MSIIVDGYCRVSTDPQEDNTSLDEQEATIRAYCAEHNLILGIIHKETFTGYLYRERKGLSAMRERYRDGKIQGIVVRTLDRLSRRQVHYAVLMDEMEYYGVQYHCVKEPVNQEDSKMAQFVQLILAFVAEMEREKIMDRTMTGRINAARNGKIVGGYKLPYGWKWQLDENGDKVQAVHHLSQLWVVRWMALKFDRGTSTIELARQLTERGIPTPEGEPGSKWHPIAIRRILSNERLTGKGQNFAYQTNPSKNPYEPIDLPDGTYPPILGDKLFARIQGRLARNKDESSRKSERPEEFLLRAGYVRCAYCGRKMSARIDRRRRDNHAWPDDNPDRYYYRCNSYDRQGTYWCAGQDVPSKAVDAWTWQELLVLADHTELIRTAIDLATSADTLAADAKAIDVSLAVWEQRAQNYLEDLEDPTLRGDSRASIRQSLNVANQNIEQLKTERQQVLLGMIDHERERQAYTDILTWCNTVKDARGELSYQRKRDFLHVLGIVVTTKRDDAGHAECTMEIELPEIRELIHTTEVHSSSKMSV